MDTGSTRHGNNVRGRFPGRMVVLALALACIVLQPEIDALVRTTLLIPDLLVFQPVRPSLAATLPPERRQVRFRAGADERMADLYQPVTARRSPAVVLALGVYPAPLDDPRLRRLGDGLARAGIAVLIPESTRLQAGTIAPEEVDDLVAAYHFLTTLPRVDRTRVGFIGLSVGGGLSLLAAADFAIRDQVAYIQTVGAYYDAIDLFRAIAARSVVDPGRDPWEPAEIAVVAFRRQVIESLNLPAEREELERSYLAADPIALDADRLTPEARLAVRLFDGGAPAQVDVWIEALPVATRHRLMRLSPSGVVGDIRAPVFIMHDRDDPLVPVGESRRLANALGQQARYRELRLFSHVVPAEPSDPWLFVNELAGLASELYRWLRAYG